MKKIIPNIALLLTVTLCLSSCVKDEIYEGPATIASVEYSPETVTNSDEVNVIAKVSDLQGIKSAKIKYTVNGETKSDIEMKSTDTEIYTAVIPTQADDSEVVFFISIINAAGFTTNSKEQNYRVGEIPVDYTNLVLNEINGNDKFIEIFNKGTEEISMKNLYIEKDGKSVWTAKENLKIAAGSYILLYSEDVKETVTGHDESLFFTGGLSAKKAVKVELFTSKNKSINKFNLVNYTTPAPASYSRFPNGTGIWVFANATPGAENKKDGDPVNGLEN